MQRQSQWLRSRVKAWLDFEYEALEPDRQVLTVETCQRQHHALIDAADREQ